MSDLFTVELFVVAIEHKIAVKFVVGVLQKIGGFVMNMVMVMMMMSLFYHCCLFFYILDILISSLVCVCNQAQELFIYLFIVNEIYLFLNSFVGCYFRNNQT